MMIFEIEIYMLRLVSYIFWKCFVDNIALFKQNEKNIFPIISYEHVQILKTAYIYVLAYSHGF